MYQACTGCGAAPPGAGSMSSTPTATTNNANRRMSPPSASAVYSREASPASVTSNSASLRQHAAERHHRGGGFRDEAALLVSDLALGHADVPASLRHRAHRSQPALANRAQEVDLQLHGREGLPFGQRRCPADAERAVGEVADDSAVHRPHRVPEAAVGIELEHCAPVVDLDEAHPQKLRDRWAG